VPDTLPLRPAPEPAPTSPVEPPPVRPELPPAVEPLLVPAPEAARLCGVSEASWYRLRSAGKVPAPVRLGGRVLWRVEEDLRAWIAAGCPSRCEWEARRAVAGNGNGRC
jgi:predicted DNA-binding transcriptional regulator AlpA